MGGSSQELSGPDLANGVAFESLADGKSLLGHAGGEAVLLVRQGQDVFATGATCSHYGGPLAEGLVVDGTVRCPWHHACFDLRTGVAAGPALNPIACFDVVREGGLVRIGAKKPEWRGATPKVSPSSVVIVGSGAAGAAAAETLRREGYDGPVTLIGAESPVDRPNLSKDYLAGNAPEEWIPLRTSEFYAEMKIARVTDETVEAIDTKAKSIRLASGKALNFGALLYATGAEPIRLPIDGANLPHVHVLRSLANSRAIIAAAATAKRAVVIGASFIGLEAAASLRARGLEVTVVGPESVPLARVVGEKVGAFVRTVHEGKGVAFRLGRKPSAITASRVTLDDGSTLEADLVIMGVGVKPRLALAQVSGLTVDNGVVVDERFQTSATDVYAAGDVARFPYEGGRARIEHWQVAERQGQAAARAMLGRTKSTRDVPFFWSAHFDVTLSYVGHAEAFDEPEIRGDLAKRDALVAYRHGGRITAIVTIGRDGASLEAEKLFEAGDVAGLEKLVSIQ